MPKPRKGVVPPQLRPFLFKKGHGKRGGSRHTTPKSRSTSKPRKSHKGGHKVAKKAHAFYNRVVGNQSAKGIAIGAIGLTGVKTLLRMVGAPNWLGRFEQPVETLSTGLILHTTGLGSADLLTAGVKEAVSEGLGV